MSCLIIGKCFVLFQNTYISTVVIYLNKVSGTLFMKQFGCFKFNQTQRVLTMLRRKQVKTRMHSSGMRTARFNGHLYRGMSAWVSVCPGGCLSGWCLPRWVYTPWTQRQTPPSGPRGRHPSLVNRMTDRCKNITFPQLPLRAVNIGDRVRNISFFG